jgi:hypothetical protein
LKENFRAAFALTLSLINLLGFVEGGQRTIGLPYSAIKNSDAQIGCGVKRVSIGGGNVLFDSLICLLILLISAPQINVNLR